MALILAGATGIRAWLTALRGALGFFTRLPVGFAPGAWAALQSTPTAFPVAGYIVGALLAPVFLLPLPDVTLAAGFLAWVSLLTGVNHADGVADLGDAMAVHGDRETRLDAMTDVAVGAGGVLLLGLSLLALALAALALASLGWAALPIVIAAEVGAKLAMVALAGFNPATHEGLASGFTRQTAPRSLLLPLFVSLPAVAFPHLSPRFGETLLASWSAGAALFGALLAAAFVGRWSRRRLGGVSGDVLGATNDLARVVGLHAGVVVWTLS